MQRFREERGYIYIWTLFAVMLSGVMLAAAGQVWQTGAIREKESQLLFVGDQFRQAIESYYNDSQTATGGGGRYPESLEELLKDERSPALKRHLRKIFIDPMTNSYDWGLVKQEDGGITGIYSLSVGVPVKRANFPEDYSTFEKAANYQDWKFTHAVNVTGGEKNGQAGSSLSGGTPGASSNPFSQPRSAPNTGANPFSGSQPPAVGNPFLRE